MNEKIWEILGIAKTKDKREITRAYRDRLSDTNPEDKPEEFKELRNAYEEALAYAEKPEEMKDEDRKADTWLKQLEDIYEDFSRRRDVAEWEDLFSDGLLEGISGRMRAESELLNYLMDHYFIGHTVWECMEKHFSFLERKEELYESYPREFIDRVIVNGILYPDILPMELFVPGKDGQACQKYLDAYLDITPEGDCQDRVEELVHCKESHPYGDALLCCRKIRQGEPEYIEKLEKICEEHEENLDLALMLGKEYLRCSEFEKAEALCRKQLEYHDDALRLKGHYADVLEAMGYYGQQYLTKAYIETTIMDKALRDEDSLKMLEVIFSNRVYDSATLYDWGGMRSVIGGLVGKSAGAFATAFAKYESKIQKAIDKTLASFEG